MTTPLLQAIINNDIVTVERLLKRGADPNQPVHMPPNVRTRPIEFAFQGSYDVTEQIEDLLLKYGAYLTDPDESKRRLPFYIDFVNLYQAKRLVNYCKQKHIDINTRNSKGQNVLFYTIDMWDDGTVEYLVDHGCDINMRDYKGRTPLMYAVKYQTLNGVKLLIKNGADPTVKNKYDNDLAYIAWKHGHDDTVEYLKSIAAQRCDDEKFLIHDCRNSSCTTHDTVEKW